MKSQLIGMAVLVSCFMATSFTIGGKHASMSIIPRVAVVSTRSPMSISMSDSAVPFSLPVIPATSVPKTSKAWDMYIKTTDVLTTLFPLWTVIFAGLAITRPSTFNWFTTKYFTATLGALMLSMGITLTPDDFTRVGKQPGAVIVGFILCYVLCPALGFGLGKAFNLPVDLIAGLVLVGSINGGQASNLCTYIAKGDVALSVLMTTVTTIAGIFMTPLLCKLILGAVVPVDAVGIAVSCIQVVLAPIVVGMAANKYLPKVTLSPIWD
jgi:BASS family bile acid:Na+ symporter